VVRVPGYRKEMYCVSCEVKTEFICVMEKKVDRLCGLVVRVSGYIMEMYCVSCEVHRVPGYRSRSQGSIPGAIRFSEN
jgi:ribosomal protein S26